MKKIIPASLMLAAVFYCAGAQAQTPPQTPAQPSQQVQTAPLTTAENGQPLDERFSTCIKDTNCSTQVRLQIIQEEADAMNDRFQKFHQACVDANFQNCGDKQKDDVQAWYSAQNNMQQLMRSIQSQDLNDKEPSAGGASPSDDNGKEKSFWQKIWPSSDDNK